ncbi:hemolytic lectin [Talaromyces proteolyticus]|uniref:Hemolytic lectin n=1 Tax=Talaromyces proteolyticus TaxID=1131652 RepID=A0AAD4KT92_9EURO|nr:hemolytic lectin [Talaromyces proteolyticus]KAH8700498.1 hemolytic lectin [Talaromyces proteolyticus]
MAYIPPKDISFRLRNCSSNYVLYSRDKNDPTFYHYGGDIADDQFWYLIPGTGDHADTYMFKSKATKKVIYSRKSNDPKVFHVDGDGKYNDNYFTLEAGSGEHKSHFRLLNAASDTVIFSRTTADPYLGNVASSYQKSDDQYWKYEFEDMVIDRISYKIDSGQIVSQTPETIGSNTLVNNSDSEQHDNWHFEKTFSTTHTWEFTSGFSIKLGETADFGVPGVAEDKVSVEATETVQYKTGSSTTSTTTQWKDVPVTAKAHSKVTATTTITRSNLAVPYTIYLKSKATGAEVTSSGIYKGVAFWDTRTQIDSEII